jgi:hypothetical protein
MGKEHRILKTGQNLTVRFQISLIELEEFDGKERSHLEKQVKI